MGKVYQVVIHGFKGQKLTIDLCNTEDQMKNMTVLQLKDRIYERLPETKGQDNIRLLYTDRHLDEDTTLLCSYGIQHLSTIQMVIKVPGGLLF